MGKGPRIPVENVSFDTIRRKGMLYVDKTSMLVPLCSDVEADASAVHVYTRPTRFGKTLNMSMIDRFFNVAYAGEPDVFEGLCISERREFDRLKNRYPVIRLNLGTAKPNDSSSLCDSL